MSTAPLAYSIREAADAASVSVNTIRHAIKSTDDKTMPHLKAKFIGGRRGYVIKADALNDWLDRLPDA